MFYFNIMSIDYTFWNTVKPVYNGNFWEPKKVAVVKRVAAVQVLVQNSR